MPKKKISFAEQERLPFGYDIAANVVRYPLAYPFAPLRVLGHKGAGERLPIYEDASQFTQGMISLAE